MVARWGALRYPGRAAALSVIPMALGVASLAAAHQTYLAVAAAVLFGVGLGIFVTHLGPLMLGASPETHLSRVQAVITLVQSLALVITMNLLGQLADIKSASTAAVVCAVVLAAGGLVTLMSPRFLSLTPGEEK